MASSRGGTSTPGARDAIVGVAAVAFWNISSARLPVNGNVPASSSNSVTPSEY